MEVEIGPEPDASFVVAHFRAHADHPIACMRSCPSGRLLATADVSGHAFHVFSIYPHPGGPTLAAVHHLYILRRGETTAEASVTILVIFGPNCDIGIFCGKEVPANDEFYV